MARRLFTSESVTEGHPDKIADQISDSILDALLAEDPKSRVAVETLVTTGLVVVAGEVTTTAYVDIPGIVRNADPRDRLRLVAEGFRRRFLWCHGRHRQPVPRYRAGRRHGVRDASDASADVLDLQGAGDQGLMFGYASNETPELMPLPITIAHRLSERLSEVRKDGTMAYLRPDGKTQVTIEYDGDRAVRIDTVVVSSQHAADISLDSMLTPDIKKHVVDPVLEQFDIDSTDYKLLVNPTGRFEIGGPMGDAGLTGRKIIIDTYGGMARHGGGAFSGKDPSKVDRSAAYAMRWVAKNIVAAGLATGSSARSRTRSARPRRSASTSTRSAPRPCRWSRSPTRCSRCSTCVRPRSSATWTCSGRSTPRPRATATSAAPARTSPGSGPTASRR